MTYIITKRANIDATYATFLFVHFALLLNNIKDMNFLNWKKFSTQRNKTIKNDAEELENQIIPACEDIATDIENKIANLDGQYKKLATEMSKQREELHREIDFAIDQMEREIGEIKLKHYSMLQKHLDEIKQLQFRMQQDLLALYETKESNEVYPTIHFSSKNDEFRKLPPTLHVSMPKFIPKKIEREELGRFIGKLTPVSNTLEERVFTAKKPNACVKELLNEPKVLNTIKTGHNSLTSITCLYEEEIWTNGNSADIKSFNIHGVLQQTVKTKSGKIPWDIVVDREGALLYTYWKTRTVYKVKNDKIEEIIRLKGWKLLNLCVTSSGDLLVTIHSDDDTQSKVIRCSGSILKQTIQFDDEGQPLYSSKGYIKHISESRNLDICVSDHGARAVTVVNQAGKLRFRNTGHASPTKNEPFVPFGITTDSQSRILTADRNNHCIHILDKDGHFLHYIDNCDLKDPFGLCMDSNDSLFVSELFKGNVKKIKYLK